MHGPIMNAHNQTTLVTGASSGIGEQFARQLGARGVNLLLTARNHERLEVLAQQLHSDRPDINIHVISADLAEPGAATDLTAQLAAMGIAVDVLINNAGFASHNQFVDEDPENVAREVHLNCTSLVELTARLLPDMAKRNRGGVINIASTAAFQPVPSMAVYAASKAFVLSFTEALWAETRTTGVRVMALCPGATETGFFDATGKQFRTSGRQSPEHVAQAGLKAFFSGNGPTVISGTANRMKANGYRFMPRPLMARMAAATVRTSQG
jgi:short-subunit dehydrogenase